MTRALLPRPVHVLLVALLGAAVAAVLLPGRSAREDPAEVLAALRASRGPRLPAASRVGASTASEPERYARDTLHEAIDGAAEAYIANGFDSAVFSIYAFGDTGREIEVAAEAHRFAGDEGARAQAEAERPRRGAAVKGVPGASSDGAMLLAVEGREMLKLTLLTPVGSAGTEGGGPDALRSIAIAWKEEHGHGR